MTFLLEIAVEVALFATGCWLFFRTRRWARQTDHRWSRRFGCAFFVAPILLWFGELALPEAWLFPLRFLVAVRDVLESYTAELAGLSEANLSWFWQVVLSPLAHVIVYGLAGMALGWPLDRLSRQPPEPLSET